MNTAIAVTIKIMYRVVFCFLAAAAAFGADSKTALDKPTLEAYVRHLYVFPPQITLQTMDPQPSDLPGFHRVVIKASNGQASQEFAFYVSKDGSKIMQAQVYDVNKNPFQNDL